MYHSIWSSSSTLLPRPDIPCFNWLITLARLLPAFTIGILNFSVLYSFQPEFSLVFLFFEFAFQILNWLYLCPHGSNNEPDSNGEKMKKRQTDGHIWDQMVWAFRQRKWSTLALYRVEQGERIVAYIWRRSLYVIAYRWTRTWGYFIQMDQGDRFS